MITTQQGLPVPVSVHPVVRASGSAAGNVSLLVLAGLLVLVAAFDLVRRWARRRRDGDELLPEGDDRDPGRGGRPGTWQ